MLPCPLPFLPPHLLLLFFLSSTAGASFCSLCFSATGAPSSIFKASVVSLVTHDFISTIHLKGRSQEKRYTKADTYLQLKRLDGYHTPGFIIMMPLYYDSPANLK